MAKFKLITIILMFLLLVSCNEVLAKSQSTGSVRIAGRSLYVNGQPYLIQGVGYSPVPIGEFMHWDMADTRTYERDFPLLKAMGCNTIRTWDNVNRTLLDYAQQYDIKVCAGFRVRSNLNLYDPAVRNELSNTFRNYVSDLKDHPALFLWALGNENNYQNGNNSAWYSLANELGEIAYQEEGDDYHPVAIINGALYNIGDATKQADDESLDYIDIWGTNFYPGRSFEDGFDDYATLSNKPMWISEYGVDAWHTNNPSNPEDGYEDQQAQAEWGRSCWLDIVQANDVCIGGTIMAYSDEWWKDPYGELFEHTYRGSAGWGERQPDGYSNEEWWGIMSVMDNGAEPDIMVPRQIYYDLFAPIPEPSSIILIGSGIVGLFGFICKRKDIRL